MASYDVYITYTKKSGKGNKKRQDIILISRTMKTLKRLRLRSTRTMSFLLTSLIFLKTEK